LFKSLHLVDEFFIVIEPDVVNIWEIKDARLAVSCQAIVEFYYPTAFIFVSVLLAIGGRRNEKEKRGYCKEKIGFHLTWGVKWGFKLIKVVTFLLLLQLHWHYYCPTNSL